MFATGGSFVAKTTSTAELGDIPIPKGYRQMEASEHASYWRDAIKREYSGLIGLGTWDVITLDSVPSGANIVNCHLIFTVKRKSDGTIDKFKARLVADGSSQRHGVDFSRVFSTVVKASTLRLILTLAAARDMNLSQLDIRQAYLHPTLMS